MNINAPNSFHPSFSLSSLTVQNLTTLCHIIQTREVGKKYEFLKLLPPDCANRVISEIAKFRGSCEDTHIDGAIAEIALATFNIFSVSNGKNPVVIQMDPQTTCNCLNALIQQAAADKEIPRKENPVMSIINNWAGETLKNWELLGNAQGTQKPPVMDVQQKLFEFVNNPAATSLMFIPHTYIDTLPEVFNLEPFVSRLKAFSCESLNLKELPATIVACQELVELNCGLNHLKSLPPNLGMCPELQFLDVGFNQLQSLSFVFGSRHAGINLWINCVGNQELNLTRDVFSWPNYCEIDLDFEGIPEEFAKEITEAMSKKDYHGPHINFDDSDSDESDEMDISVEG